MPAILDAVPAPTSGGSTAVLHRSRRTRIALLSLQACCLILSVLTMALMANVLYIARNIEIEDPGFVIHRASSALVVWAGAGGIVNAAIVSYLVYSAATRPGKIFGLNITGRQNFPLRPLPTLTFLLAFAFMRSLVATCYAFTDFDAADALALAWDGEFDTRPSFFTPETYAANQGWGDGTSPQVANRAAAARGCCAALTALAGVGLLAVLVVWRKERMVVGRERVGSVGGGEGEGEGGAGGFKTGEEVEGREVVEMGEGRRVELAGSDGRHEAEGKQMHEMDGGGAGAHEVQGTQIHEMAGGEEQQRRVYEMDASEAALRGEDAVKWERHP
ncbi:hypothetical protein BFW01_g1455 [Lasiodiplodia theobromae]|uniref:Uncharacterized protein n=1 Tax=Lasiodiplodia theobromae TaxID=45133 RepID=A0A8H7MCA6_9PEZI|nr:hypothetical protein BFW01_g1455 [Lasiodiplodia theobromae]